MIVLQELKRILQNRWERRLLIVVPILITIYFAFLFQQGIIHHIPAVVVDQDRSEISREVTQQFRESQYFQILDTVEDVKEANELVLNEQVDMIIEIPSKFSKDLKEGKKVNVGLIADGSNMAVSSTALRKASEIVLTYNAGTQIQKIEGKALSNSNRVMNVVQPLNFQVKQIYNTVGNYGDFLIWGLLAAIAHFPIMIFTVVSLHDIREAFSFNTFFARLFSYLLLGLTQLLTSLAIIINFTSIKFQGDMLSLVLLSGFFVLTIVSFGMFISSIIPSRFVATEIGMIVVLPALLLSGYTWPLDQMPWFIQILGKAEPLTYYVHPLRDLAASGMVTSQYWSSLAILGIMAASFTLASILIKIGGVKSWQKKSVTP